jgi:hypothetical protein
MELDETSGTWSIGRANLRSLQIADDSPGMSDPFLKVHFGRFTARGVFIGLDFGSALSLFYSRHRAEKPAGREKRLFI